MCAVRRRAVVAVVGGFSLALAAWLLAPAALTLHANAIDATSTRDAIGGRLSPERLAQLIDSAVAEAWSRFPDRVSPPADDAEFLRRVFLDLVGKTPTVSEAQDFLDDPSPNKRSLLVEELLSRGAFATHLSNVWREMLLSGASNAAEARQLAQPLDAWLRLRFATNTPYDRLARELLTAQSPRVSNRRMARDGAGGAQPSPLAFYQANQRKPEQLAASASRIFLGLQVQCAQCHDHPFAKWSRKEFWSFAAFFSGLDRGGDESDLSAPVQDSLDREGITIPETELVAEPRFLDGEFPDWRPDESKRAALARWLAADANPYFAKAAVNRVFDLLLGRGFVTPVDDLDPANPPVFPELFDVVARQFVLHDHDLKYLIRAITLTAAYQRSSQAGPDREASEDDLPPFARMPLKRLSSDQLYDSLVQATGYREANSAGNRAALGMNLSTRAEFQNRFANAAAGRGESETSILHALALMNGKLAADATTLATSETLAAVVDAPFLTDDERIETLFLAALARRPAEDERKLVHTTLERPGANRDRRAAFADLFWALLNSTEFAFNH